MMRSMFSGVSGTRSHQVRMDVIGNNIANINTIGFKAGRVEFAEVFSQTLRGASAPVPGGRGGINPMQVGLGVMVRSIDNILTQGNLETTGKITDLAIDGDGFFVLSDGVGLYYSRDGAFSVGADGTLASAATGMRVQGWMADANGAIDWTQPTGDIMILTGQTMIAQATTQVTLRGNLDARATEYDPGPPPTGDTFACPIKVYDSLGAEYEVTMTFVKTGENAWAWTAEYPPGTTVGSGTIDFDSNGRFAGSTGGIRLDLTNGATTPQDIAVDFSTLTQYGVDGSVKLSFQNGFPPGTLDTFSINDAGLITGKYSNGQNRILGQIALAAFANPEGILKVGSNLYTDSPNSGVAQIGPPSNGGRGRIVAYTLEMSNVDLAREFTDMIITQRGFQANTRIITTADDMLQDLINLRR